MSELILHAYDASPFTQRALRLLGIKNLDWRWVETPMMPPKEELIALTGGYRGTPVLQAGSDIYVDSRLIALELERRFPQPSLFPSGDPGTALALITWSDRFFAVALRIIVATRCHTWPEAFRKDREMLFPQIDFRTVGMDLDHAKSQYRAHACLLERQLADGRPFLTGESPGLADAFAYPFVWVMQGAVPEIAAQLLSDFPHITAWEERLASQGEGRRTRIDAATALAEARASEPRIPAHSDRYESHSRPIGTRVSVAPDDTRRGAVEGELVAICAQEIAVLREGERTGRVVVHFPRIGYRVTPL